MEVECISLVEKRKSKHGTTFGVGNLQRARGNDYPITIRGWGSDCLSCLDIQPSSLSLSHSSSLSIFHDHSLSSCSIFPPFLMPCCTATWRHSCVSPRATLYRCLYRQSGMLQVHACGDQWAHRSFFELQVEPQKAARWILYSLFPSGGKLSALWPCSTLTSNDSVSETNS